MSDPRVSASAIATATRPPVGTTGNVRAAVARAAEATGVDFDYLMAQARLESALDPEARAPTSSATGLYQFTRGTWLQTLERHAGKHGLGWLGTAAADPAARGQVLAMRFDPQLSALMAGELANDNRAVLSGVLGREPDATELYLGHFLGAGGASKFLAALAADPGRPAAAILPAAAAANRSIFYAGGAPRSLGEVMDLMRSKMAGAMDGVGQAGFEGGQGGVVRAGYTPQPGTGGPIAREWQAARAELPATRTRSMAETLDASFGGQGRASGHVAAAYQAFARFGM